MPHILTCQNCGKIFTANISKQRAKERQYCSRECSSIGLRKPWKICPVCGKEFRPYKSATTYCSKKCYFSTKPQYQPTTCLYCGNQFLDKRHPHKQYCDISCFRQAKARKIKIRRETCYVTIKCQYCEKPFTVTESDAKTRKFCSKICSNRYHQVPDPAKKATFICKWCGKEFVTWKYRNSTICSNQCRSEYGARQPKPNARRPENFVTRQCDYCGKPYTIHKCLLERGNGSKYCSYDCLYKANSDRMTGSNNPNFIDGSSPQNYGTGWYRQKSLAKKRDNSTCQWCGKKRKRIHVHHIIPVRLFNGNTDKANQLTNLICLCAKCHAKLEYSSREDSAVVQALQDRLLEPAYTSN